MKGKGSLEQRRLRQRFRGLNRAEDRERGNYSSERFTTAQSGLSFRVKSNTLTEGSADSFGAQVFRAFLKVFISVFSWTSHVSI